MGRNHGDSVQNLHLVRSGSASGQTCFQSHWRPLPWQRWKGSAHLSGHYPSNSILCATRGAVTSVTPYRFSSGSCEIAQKVLRGWQWNALSPLPPAQLSFPIINTIYTQTQPSSKTISLGKRNQSCSHSGPLITTSP